MNYSIAVTILLIIITTLFIVSLRNAIRNEERLGRLIQEANSQLSNTSTKVLQLTDKANFLSKQVRYLESELEEESRRCSMCTNYVSASGTVWSS